MDAYLARQLPVSAVLIALLGAKRAQGLRSALLIAGLIQAGDAAIGARHKQSGMIFGSTFGAAVHLGSVLLLGRKRRQPS